MTRLHYLLARNTKRLPFGQMSPLQQRLLIDHGRESELMCTDGSWLFFPRCSVVITAADYTDALVYRLSSACRPLRYREDAPS